MEAWSQRLAGRSRLTSPLGRDGPRIFLGSVLLGCPWTTNATVRLSFPVPPSVITWKTWYRNINLLSIAYAFRPRLRSRLTLRRLALLRKPWAIGGGVSHSSFVTNTGILTSRRSTAASAAASLQRERSPTTPHSEVRRFGTMLEPRELSAHVHLTSELLRTL